MTDSAGGAGVIQYEYHSEGTHGVRTTCKDIPGLRSTLFPQTTGLAATGNMTLIEEMAGVMGTEGRALNNIANGTTFDKGTGLDYWGPTTNIGCAPTTTQISRQNRGPPRDGSVHRGGCRLQVHARALRSARRSVRRRPIGAHATSF